MVCGRNTSPASSRAVFSVAAANSAALSRPGVAFGSAREGGGARGRLNAAARDVPLSSQYASSPGWSHRPAPPARATHPRAGRPRVQTRSRRTPRVRVVVRPRRRDGERGRESRGAESDIYTRASRVSRRGDDERASAFRERVDGALERARRFSRGDAEREEDDRRGSPRRVASRRSTGDLARRPRRTRRPRSRARARGTPRRPGRPRPFGRRRARRRASRGRRSRSGSRGLKSRERGRRNPRGREDRPGSRRTRGAWLVRRCPRRTRGRPRRRRARARRRPGKRALVETVEVPRRTRGRAFARRKRRRRGRAFAENADPGVGFDEVHQVRGAEAPPRVRELVSGEGGGEPGDERAAVHLATRAPGATQARPLARCRVGRRGRPEGRVERLAQDVDAFPSPTPSRRSTTNERRASASETNANARVTNASAVAAVTVARRRRSMSPPDVSPPFPPTRAPACPRWTAARPPTTRATRREYVGGTNTTRYWY